MSAGETRRRAAVFADSTEYGVDMGGGNTRRHAVVIGASIAGLCAARVLSEFFDRVTVFERDELPSTPGNRTAVPQGRHVHLLMARGAMEFDGLFPGLLDDMVAAGVPILENRPDCIYFGAAGHVLGTGHTLRDEFTAYVPSRPQLEWQLRQRVRQIDNVEIQRRSVAQPRFDVDAARVTGVLLDSDADEPDFVAADIVVDAAGRGTRLPVWLEQWGYQRPSEHTVDVGIGYASHQLRLPQNALRERVIVAGASREQPIGLGLLGYEDGTWTLTTFGVGKVEPPHTFSEMIATAKRILPERISTSLELAEPVGEPAFHRYPTSRWRRYHKLERFPAGILPLGDAVASFDPTYGQGMTMTSLQAGHLRRALAEGADENLARKVNRATAKTTYPVWMMTAIGDLTLHNATGPMPRWYRPVGSLFDQFLGAAETDPVLAEWFLRRFSLLDSLYMVPSAKLVGRTVRHNMRLWLAERRAGRRERVPA
jgi:2-polyprenyl-6-methoxyphenol hydroxylase-like FAD-dependent oxidoreductase